MGREVKRVPVDFDWPLKKTWHGYLQPERFDFPPCPDCSYEANPTIIGQLFPSPPQGSGYTPEAYAIAETFYPHMIGGPMANLLAWHDKLGQKEVDFLVAKGRLRDLTHRWNPETRTREPVGETVTAKSVNALNARGGHLHDAINRSYLIEFRCEMLGIEMLCPTCDGNGDVATAEERDASENWEGTGPPEGEGWQLWETVSEGSPISPVFATPEELAQWMTRNDCTVNGPVADFDVALKFVLAGWAPSFVTSPETGFTDGVNWIGKPDSEVTA